MQDRLQFLLDRALMPAALRDRQDEGYSLFQAEQQEAAGLVELAEFLSLLRLRSTRVTKQA